MKIRNKNLHFRNKSSIVLIMLLFFLFKSFSDANSTTINIIVQNFSFTPSNINALVGDTIKWNWINGFHTTTCDGDRSGTSLPSKAVPWNSPLNSGNPIFIYKITVAGLYKYTSVFNNNIMHGSIMVEMTLPVELTDFVATTIKNEVILDWVTYGEINNDKFEIQRVDLNNLTENPVDLLFQTIGILNGNGTSNQSHYYKFVDRNLGSGIYLYRLKQV